LADFDRDAADFRDPDVARRRLGDGAGRERRGRAVAGVRASLRRPPIPTALRAAVARSMILRAASMPIRAGRVMSEFRFMRAF
jgi:hypothetical protein